MNGTAAPHYTPGNEPGQQDNLLTVDPNDDRWKSTLDSWSDGQTYEGVTVNLRQIEPGKFELLALQAAPEAEAGAEAETPAETGTEGGTEEPGDTMGSENPAIAGLMRSRRG